MQVIVGLIGVSEDGAVFISSTLDAPARRILSLDLPLRVAGLVPLQKPYLGWHRDHVFRSGRAEPATGVLDEREAGTTTRGRRANDSRIEAFRRA